MQMLNDDNSLYDSTYIFPFSCLSNFELRHIGSDSNVNYDLSNPAYNLNEVLKSDDMNSDCDDHFCFDPNLNIFSAIIDSKYITTDELLNLDHSLGSFSIGYFN